jgi:hypothetical protein
MKSITLLLLVAVLCSNATAQSPVKKTVIAKPATTVKPKTAIKPVVKKDSAVVKQLPAPPPAPKIPTRAEILHDMVLDASKKCYGWQLFNDGYGYYANEKNTDGIDSLFIHPFTDTATRFITDCIGLDGIVKYRLYHDADTALKIVMHTYIKNFGTWYKVGVNGPIVSEKDLYDYKWYHTGNILDSVVQYEWGLRAMYNYVRYKDSTGLRLKKYQSDNRRLWFEAWLNPLHQNTDSLQYYTYNSFTPYYPEKVDMVHFRYNTTGTKLLQLKACSDMAAHIAFRKFHLNNFEYNDKGQITGRTQYFFMGKDTLQTGLGVSIMKYEYYPDGLLMRYTPLGGTSQTAPFVQPAAITITTTNARTFTNMYDGSGNITSTNEFYEDQCITDKSIYKYKLSPERYVYSKEKVPNIVTRCQY